MMSKVPTRSPSSSPPEAEIDLEQIEDAVRQLECLPYALWPDEWRAEHDMLVEAAAHQLLELHALGRIRLTCTADGRLEAEVLEPVRH